MYKALLVGLFAAVPSSTNFTLQAYDFGNGAGAPSSSNYQLQASAGGQGGSASSSLYGLPMGIRASTSVPVPLAPTFVNPSNYYDRLRVTLNVSGQASDTKYLVAISDDNFVTTKYVQTDQTVGANAGVANYQSYAAWGGASGFMVLDLDPNTTYKIKVAALQGSATGSAFGPMASAATVAPSLTFAVSTSASGSPPFSASFASLPAGNVTSATATILADVSTNALGGGTILIKSQNGGLNSSTASFSLASATADLTPSSKGYGAQVSSTTQSSGGPIVATSPFNGASANVGGLGTSWQNLASFASAVTSGNVSLALKAKTDITVPAANDYTDVLSISLAPSF